MESHVLQMVANPQPGGPELNMTFGDRRRLTNIFSAATRRYIPLLKPDRLVEDKQWFQDMDIPEMVWVHAILLDMNDVARRMGIYGSTVD